MYNNDPYNDSYIDPLRRRFQQPTLDAPVPAPVQPTPMYAQPQPTGPQMPMQMVPMGEEGGQQPMDLSGFGALLKRFKKPAEAGPAEAEAAWKAGGSL